MQKLTFVNFVANTNLLPLGPLSIITNLNRKLPELEVRFSDFQLRQPASITLESLAKDLSDDSDYLCVSTISMMLPLLLPALENVKKSFPDKVIVLGGPAASPIAELLLSKFSCVDFVVEGEGETALPKLIAGLQSGAADLRDIPNLVYRDGGAIRKNPRLREDFSSLPVPDLGLVDVGRYNPTIPVMTSRGCPYGCSFCYNRHMWQGRTQIKKAEEVLAEACDRVQRCGTSSIMFVDDLFFSSKARVLEFTAEYRRRGCSFKYFALGQRLDRVDEECFAELAGTNCEGVAFGIESGSGYILKKINKELDLAGNLHKFAVAKKYFRDVQTSFIYGFPFETMEHFDETLAVAGRLKELGCNVVMNLLIPQNNTALYEEYKGAMYYDPGLPALKPRVLEARETALIKTDKEIFAWYHHYKSENIREKLQKYIGFVAG